MRLDLAPRVYTSPRELTPRIERWMREKGFIDGRRVERLPEKDRHVIEIMQRLKEATL